VQKFFLQSPAICEGVCEGNLLKLHKNRSFSEINTIIERDSKDTTYKFALLRAVIEISQEYDHLKKERGNRVEFPIGPVIEKWLLYYYPLIENDDFIPQKNGETEQSVKKISFRTKFKRVTDYYKNKGGFSAFWNDYQNESIPKEIAKDLMVLVKHLNKTITNMPMRYIGRSLYKQEYSIFHFENRHSEHSNHNSINSKYLRCSFGTFSFNKRFFDVFRYLGSFISGEDSLLFKWAKFSVNADNTGALTFERALKKISTVPETERLTQRAKGAFRDLFVKQSFLDCAWTGDRLRNFKKVDIDHIIPFSVWKNNDLWNLIPVKKSVNIKKSNQIPFPDLVEQQKKDIIFYWNFLRNRYQKQFDHQIFASLTGKKLVGTYWQETAIEQLKMKCDYLINVRGMEGWKI
jgi:hypothetical protein